MRIRPVATDDDDLCCVVACGAGDLTDFWSWADDGRSEVARLLERGRHRLAIEPDLAEERLVACTDVGGNRSRPIQS